MYWAGTTKTSTNDARRVDWALGEYFFFSSFFLILTNIL